MRRTLTRYALAYSSILRLQDDTLGSARHLHLGCQLRTKHSSVVSALLRPCIASIC